MELMDEIKQTAQELGALLGAEACVADYLSQAKAVQQDAAVVELETQYMQLYQKLAEREKAGEPLDRGELDEYYSLKRQIQTHPLIESRDLQKEAVKAVFVETAQRLTSILGFSYTDFAR